MFKADCVIVKGIFDGWRAEVEFTVRGPAKKREWLVEMTVWINEELKPEKCFETLDIEDRVGRSIAGQCLDRAFKAKKKPVRIRPKPRKGQKPELTVYADE